MQHEYQSDNSRGWHHPARLGSELDHSWQFVFLPVELECVGRFPDEAFSRCSTQYIPAVLASGERH